MAETLLIPGPTPLSPEVREAVAGQMINHRGEAFGRILAGVLDGLKAIFQTTSPVLPLTASGTGGLEAAVANVLSPGDRVLALVCGSFGERFAEIARVYGAEVVRVEVEWGQGVEAGRVADALRRTPDVRAVLVTHSETSTGVANPVGEIAGAVRPSGALVLVDAISSLGALDLPMDAWGPDVVVTGSQKALMAPPGLALVAVGPRAWEASRAARMPRLYFSFQRALDAIGPGGAQTPFTPALPVAYALAVTVPAILREGLPAVFARHSRLAEATRRGIEALDLAILPERRWASDTVTAVRAPGGVAVGDLLRTLRDEHGVVLAGGQGRLAGRIFRIAHMGAVTGAQIVDGLAALGRALGRGDAGAAAAAAALGR